MAYLNFTKIAPPAPNDPVVNEVTQLNNNWDHLDAKLQPYLVGGSINDVEIGQEFLDTNFRFAVWNGTQRIPDDIDAAWSAWTALPMFSPRAARPSFTPQWRNNSAYRMVELAGGVYFNVAQDPWTLGGYNTINADSSGAIPASMVPIGGTHTGQAAAGLTSGTSVVAGAMITVDKPGGNTFVRIRGQYMGGPGGGNFIQLDRIWWWY
jgi:hypothetical protein